MEKNRDDDIYIFNNEDINDIKEDATSRSAADPSVSKKEHEIENKPSRP